MRLRGLLSVTLLLAACDLPFTGPDGERIGLVMHPQAMTVDLTSGAPFVTVTTSGYLGCSRPSRTDVKRSGNSLVIVPYDVWFGDRCASMYTSHKHTVFLDRYPAGTYQISAKIVREGSEEPVVTEAIEVTLP